MRNTTPQTHNTGLITVRTSSSRLPNKCLLPLGDETVISHVIKRAISYGIDPIVCTSTDASDDILVEISKQLGVKYFRGSLLNKLQRWLDCAENFDLDYFHTVDADDPFFDGDQMRESIELLLEERLDMVGPTPSSSVGGASVGYSLTTDIVKRALHGVAADADTEMMWSYIEKISNLRSKVLPETTSETPNIRLTLDYEEDYWMIASLVNILGNEATRTQINDFFNRNPDFPKINFFRNQEWKKAQLDKELP